LRSVRPAESHSLRLESGQNVRLAHRQIGYGRNVTGSLALVLHAHLPFVRHPEHEFFHEENWLFEAITEAYVPLSQMLQRLLRRGVQFKITLSVSPTLCAMLSDRFLRERYIRHLDRICDLVDRECERNHADKNLLALSQFYRDFFTETRRTFAGEWGSDLLGVFRRLRGTGTIEIIASAATHAILPILQQSPGAANAQIAIGCDQFRETFGGEPCGFWLPECAYSAGIAKSLQAQNIRWFVVDAHALGQAIPPARRGTFAPCFTRAGPAAFARDIQASRQIWSAQGGYPGDAAYRDFYRDIGFDLSADEIRPLPKNAFTGIKYYRVTGGDGVKQLYDRAAAEETAHRHAHHFVERCIAELESLPANDWNPIMTVPFDAELFGHWWFEGPIFLEQVILAAIENNLSLTTPSNFLEQNTIQQVTEPAASSWGDRGFLDVWLDEKCGWIYPHIFTANTRMRALAKSRNGDLTAEKERVLRQLARELLLAQSSDWAFLIRNGTAKDYAIARVTDHLLRFQKLAAQLEHDKVDRPFLAQCEERDNLFPNVEWRHFR
jgi:1,4-alpha-glucan branching enzyme